MTPAIKSYHESKIRAFNGALGSPLVEGKSRKSLPALQQLPAPLGTLLESRYASPVRMSALSVRKSLFPVRRREIVLLITGISSRLFSIAR